MGERLSRGTKFLYGIGDTGFSLTGTILGAYFAIFLTDVVGLPAALAAGAIFVGRSWDYINDPLIGHISDRTGSRWGRRRPFLLFGALPFAVGFALLWWKPPLQSNLHLAIYYGLAYVVFDAAATFVYMPYFALTPELTSDYDERTSLTSYRMFFSIFASLVAFTVPMMMVGAFSPQRSGRVLQMGAVFGLLSALPLWLTFVGTRERREFVAQERPRLLQSLRAAVRNRPFVFSLVIYLLTWVSMNVVQATLLFFLKYVVFREAQSDMLMAAIFVTAIAALPFWQWTARRWSKRLAYIGGIGFWAAVQVVLITLGPASGLGLILVLCVLAGIGVSAAHVLPWSIIPDAVEWGELLTGERHEGMFYSLVTLMEKITSSLAIPLVLLLLDATGYIPNKAQQPGGALLGIRIAIGPVPALFLCTGILFAALYPLSRERYSQVLRELEDRRARGAAL